MNILCVTLTDLLTQSPIHHQILSEKHSDNHTRSVVHPPYAVTNELQSDMMSGQAHRGLSVVALPADT
jgi:hypothetical protein